MTARKPPPPPLPGDPLLAPPVLRQAAPFAAGFFAQPVASSAADIFQGLAVPALLLSVSAVVCLRVLVVRSREVFRAKRRHPSSQAWSKPRRPFDWETDL